MNIFNRTFSQSISIAALLFLFSSGCKKEEANTPIVHETGTMTDIEGNIYKTVKIGNQWWMAENLKVKKYRNRFQINIGQDSIDWTQSSGAYCLYEKDASSPGLLYNWFTVNDTSNLAPAGWHIPTDDEWKALERFLGMSSNDADNVSWRGTHEAEKLKIELPDNWHAYGDVWSTNESGFSALAGSCRLDDSRWGTPGLFSTGFWWTATEKSNTNDAWYRYLDYKNANVFRSKCSKNYGFSIRCVKD